MMTDADSGMPLRQLRVFTQTGPITVIGHPEMQRLRFDVFGRRIDVEATSDGWVAYVPGNDGKRRLANFSIPSDLEAAGIAQYLDDLFHEGATAKHSSVRLL